MKVLLVRPPKSKNAVSLGDFMFAEPIGLECIYALLKDKHQVKILDMMAEKVNLPEQCKSWKPEVVGITTLCVDVKPVLELAHQIKSFDPKIITVVGGTQAFLSPETYFCEQIDHVVRYTTIQNIGFLFGQIAKGSEIPLIDGIHSRFYNFKSTDTLGFNDYVVPDRSSTHHYRKYYSWFGYKPCAILQTSRGCSARCTFCLRWGLEGSIEQEEPIATIIGQILEINEPNIMITDNNFLFNGQRLEEFCTALEEATVKKNFLCYGSVDSIIKNKEVIAKFARLGLKAVIVGFESFKDMELTGYRKKATADNNLEAAKILKSLQIDCWAAFILNPDWDIEDFGRLRNYISQITPEFAALSPLTPFPGGPIYEQYKERILYDNDDHDNWSFSIITVLPSKMSLRRYYYEVLKTNLYVNMFVNRPLLMLDKYYAVNFFRILGGSIKFALKYLKLFVKG